jgi:hypothetical protein
LRILSASPDVALTQINCGRMAVTLRHSPKVPAQLGSPPLDDDR